MPVISLTDRNTDIGTIMMEHNFGLWSMSGDLYTADQNIDKLIQSPELREAMGQNGFNFFIKHFTVDHSYNAIMKHFNLST